MYLFRAYCFSAFINNRVGTSQAHNKRQIPFGICRLLAMLTL